MSFLTSNSVKYVGAILAMVWAVIYLANRNGSDQFEPGPEIHDQGHITRIYGFEPSTKKRVNLLSTGLHTLRIRSIESRGGIAYEIAAKNYPETLVYKVDSSTAPALAVGDKVDLVHMDIPMGYREREVMVLYIQKQEAAPEDPGP